jgi:hypothetical protein
MKSLLAIMALLGVATTRHRLLQDERDALSRGREKDIAEVPPVVAEALIREGMIRAYSEILTHIHQELAEQRGEAYPPADQGEGGAQ